MTNPPGCVCRTVADSEGPVDLRVPCFRGPRGRPLPPRACGPRKHVGARRTAPGDSCFRGPHAPGPSGRSRRPRKHGTRNPSQRTKTASENQPHPIRPDGTGVFRAGEKWRLPNRGQGGLRRPRVPPGRLPRPRPGRPRRGGRRESCRWLRIRQTVRDAGQFDNPEGGQSEVAGERGEAARCVVDGEGRILHAGAERFGQFGRTGDIDRNRGRGRFGNGVRGRRRGLVRGLFRGRGQRLLAPAAPIHRKDRRRARRRGRRPGSWRPPRMRPARPKPSRPGDSPRQSGRRA